MLFEHFVDELAVRHQRDRPLLSRDHMSLLIAHDWRGNVRELRNVAERFVLHLGPGFGGIALEDDADKEQTLIAKMDAVEARFIKTALTDNCGNIQLTADELGIPRRTLNDKIRKHGIDKKEKD